MLFGNAILLFIPAAMLNYSFGHSLPQSIITEKQEAASRDTSEASATDSAAIPEAQLVSLNRHVAGFAKSYIKKEAEFLRKMEARSARYFPAIEDVLEQYDLPHQLKYLAIVESKLNPKALSPAGAKGLWQLMPATAKELGLKINDKTDQRSHLYRSTVAAAKYLRNLYATYGDWLLVLAAYNCGPGNVNKAIKKSGSRNFWAIQKFLPPESRGHVKRYIGVHLYFEGSGSVTTQTKAEAKAWQEMLLSGELAVR